MNASIPNNFYGYAGEPQSELDVAFLMGLLYDHLPFRIVVTSITDGFPDCEGIDPETGRHIRIELEVFSRNYLMHGHPMKGCDFIVCWRDNWTDSPVRIISLERLIQDNNLAGDRFIFIPRPGSLAQQLLELQEGDKNAFEIVTYFLTDVIPRLYKKYPLLFVDTTLRKHFNVRVNNHGIFGIYPQGKLVCLREKEFVKRFGKGIQSAANEFRSQVIGIKVLTKRDDADRIGVALEAFLAAIRQNEKT